MIGFCPLASGSKGNCIYVGTSHVKILIDAGISSKSIIQKLKEIDVDICDIDAILITHEHTDHIAGLKGLSYQMNIPVFANSETAKGIVQYFKAAPKFKIFATNETFEFMDLVVHPFSIQHDTPDPVAFTIQTDKYKMGFCADLGFASSTIEQKLKNCDFLYLEANHQPSMVHACSRPMIYKNRVLSRLGHLSNEDCGKLLAKIYHSKLQKVYLAHLSQECNHPDLAVSVVQNELNDKELAIRIAYQNQVSEPTLL